MSTIIPEMTICGNHEKITHFAQQLYSANERKIYKVGCDLRWILFPRRSQLRWRKKDTQNWPENSLWSDELLTLTTTLNATKRTRTVCVKDINTLSLEMDNEFLLLLCFKILQFLLIRFLSLASQKVNGRQGEMYPLIRTLRGVKCVQVANLNAFGIFVNSKCILILAQSNDAEARHISKRGEDGS